MSCLDAGSPAGRNCALACRAVLGLLTISVVACSRPPPANVVWVVVDALSARDVSLYGGPADATPFLAGLESDAIVFDRAYSQASGTLYSAASYLTGRYPHDALKGNRLRPVPDLAGQLRSAGYATAAFSENPWVAPITGFAASFDTFEQIGTPAGRRLGYRDSEATVRSALRWFDDAAPAPRFLYVHLIPPHAPYSPPKPFRGRLTAPRGGHKSRFSQALTGVRPGAVGAAELEELVNGEESLPAEELRYLHRRYLENVTFADHLIRTVVDGVRASGASDSTLIVISSDHGEAFGPHDELFHGAALYDTQIHVPLLMIAPPSLAIDPGRRRGPVELVDVLPTVLELVGLEPPAGLAGESLVPWLRGAGEAPTLARSFVADAQATITADWKLIRRTSGDVLFDLRRDPGELEDRAADVPDVRRRLADSLIERTEEGSAAHEPMSAERRAELEALGYVVEPGSESTESTEPTIDAQ